LPDAAKEWPSPIGMPPGSSASADMRGLIMWDVSSELLALPALRRMPLGGRPLLTLSPSDLQYSLFLLTTNQVIALLAECQSTSADGFPLPTISSVRHLLSMKIRSALLCCHLGFACEV